MDFNVEGFNNFETPLAYEKLTVETPRSHIKIENIFCGNSKTKNFTMRSQPQDKIRYKILRKSYAVTAKS